MKNKMKKSVFTIMLAVAMCFMTSCSVARGVVKIGGKEYETQNFAEAHDAFQTTLASKDNDNDSIPEPPEGLFDLVEYPSKVGDLAAYVSSDPGDGEKHPMIIWIVGGWGNGIDDFPWVYPEWDNDQTGSAFWQAGVLTMYPSFRGGNGNPGYYETLFGEVDDIVSAYEYAASLPYVDPDRIYLGGHSTGGTRALLAAEYTDKFRAVFGFGAVDNIEYHNNSQFTFDTNNKDEYKMRSPIYWLDSVKTPTFLMEGSEGNASNLRTMEKAAQNNDNIHCYILEGEDHFSVLAPLTRLVAQKILADTGAEPDISITQEELEKAMTQEPPVLVPAMWQYTIDTLGMHFSLPYIWEIEDISQNGEIAYGAYSIYEEYNPWDMSFTYIDAYMTDEEFNLQTLAESDRANGYDVTELEISGFPAVKCVAMVNNDGTTLKNSFVAVEKDGVLTAFDFYVLEEFADEADSLFEAIAGSITFE